MKTDQEKIDYILDRFDFEKVKKVMDALEWEWQDKGVPELWDLRERARELLKSAIKHNASFRMGGFEASCSNGWLELGFIVSREEYLDDEEIDERKAE